MAAFPNLNSDAGLKKLDEHLLTRYFITSHKASKDDITVYAALSKPPPSQYVNASRWYNHIETLLSISGISSERNGVTIDGLTSITEEAAANSKDGVVVVDDDYNDQDVELIGEEAEEEKKAANEEKAASLTATIEKEVSWESMVMVIQPEDGETDMKKLEEDIRYIQVEGVIWGASLILIKPNDDEADLKKLEEAVRSIQVSGLFWGASKLVPGCYGIKMLGIECTAVAHLVDPGLYVRLDTILKEQIIDNRNAESFQTLGLKRICNGITTEEESDSKDDAADDDDDDVDLFGEERAAGKSWLVLTELHGDNPYIKEAEEGLRSNQMTGVVWRASKIVKVGYGFMFLRTLFTIVDDLVSLNTAIQITGGIPLTREYRMEKNSKGKLY